jgi:hypothetical protein
MKKILIILVALILVANFASASMTCEDPRESIRIEETVDIFLGQGDIVGFMDGTTTLMTAGLTDTELANGLEYMTLNQDIFAGDSRELDNRVPDVLLHESVLNLNMRAMLDSKGNYFENAGLPTAFRNDAPSMEEKMNSIQELIAAGGIIPLVDGREMLQREVGNYGLFRYAPFDPSKISRPADLYELDPARYYQDPASWMYADAISKGQTSWADVIKGFAMLRGASGAEGALLDAMQDYRYADIYDFTGGVNPISEGIPYAKYDFDAPYVEVHAMDVFGEETVIPHKLQKIFDSFDTVNCNEELPFFFWMASRGVLPEILRVKVSDGLVCNYMLRRDSGSHMEDPFTDPYETGFIALKEYDSVLKYGNQFNNMSFEDYEIEKASGSTGNTILNPARMNLPFVDYHAKTVPDFYKDFYVQVVPASPLINCTLDDDDFIGYSDGSASSAEFRDSNSTGTKLLFDGDDKITWVTGSAYGTNLTADEKKSIITAFKNLKARANEDYIGFKDKRSWFKRTWETGATFFTPKLILSSLYNAPNALGILEGRFSAKQLTALAVDNKRASLVEKMLTNLTTGTSTTREAYARGAGFSTDLTDWHRLTKELSTGKYLIRDAAGRTLPVGAKVAGAETITTATRTALDNALGAGSPDDLQAFLTALSNFDDDAVRMGIEASGPAQALSRVPTGSISSGIATSAKVTPSIKASNVIGREALRSLRNVAGARIEVAEIGLKRLTEARAAGIEDSWIVKRRLKDLAGRVGLKEPTEEGFKRVVSNNKAVQKAVENGLGTSLTRTGKFGTALNRAGAVRNALKEGIKRGSQFVDERFVFAGSKIVRNTAGYGTHGARTLFKGTLGAGGFSAFIWGEIIGNIISHSTRAACRGIAHGKGDKFAEVSFGLDCKKESIDSLACDLKKKYTVPTFFQEFTDCLDNWGVKFLNTLSGFISFTGEPGAKLAWERGVKNMTLKITRVDKISDTVSVDLFLKGGENCDGVVLSGGEMQESEFKDFLNEERRIVKDILEDDDLPKIEVTVTEGKACEMFLLVGIKPSNNYLALLGGNAKPLAHSSGKEFLDDETPFLSSEDFTKLFGSLSDDSASSAVKLSLDYAKTVGEIYDTLSPAERPLTGYDDDFKLLSMYGFIMKSDNFTLSDKYAEDLPNYIACKVDEWAVDSPEFFSKDYAFGFNLVKYLGDKKDAFLEEWENGDIVKDFGLVYTNSKGEPQIVAAGSRLYSEKRDEYKKYYGSLEGFALGTIEKEDDSTNLAIRGLTDAVPPEEKPKLVEAIDNKKIHIRYYGEKYKDHWTEINNTLKTISDELFDHIKVRTIQDLHAIAERMFVYYVDDAGKPQGLAFGEVAAGVYDQTAYNKIIYHPCNGWVVDFIDSSAKTNFITSAKANINKLQPGLEEIDGVELTDDEIEGIFNEIMEIIE